MRRVLSTAVVALCVATITASAATRTVPGEYPRIQAGIDAAVDGDVVLVSPGVYYETINFGGKNILVTSIDPNDPKVVGYTILNAEEDGTVVTFENGEGPNAVLRGFTITGGVGTFSQELTAQVNGARAFAGPGIYCFHASPTITKNVIARNIGTFDVMGQQANIAFGGGICTYESSPTITHNTIKGNSAWIGGGILCWFGEPIISNNVICENSSYEGGGVCMFSGSLYNNTIVRNDCGLGDAIGQPASDYGGNVLLLIVSQGGSRVFNNIICGALSGNGVLCQGNFEDAVFAFNDGWDNFPSNYGTVNPQNGQITVGDQADQTGTAGNMSGDPLFLNPFNSDYHLTLESPCINAGDPEYAVAAGLKDIDGQARIYGARIDIGADEYVGYVKPVASAGFDRHVLEPLQAVTLDGSESFFYDPCGVKTFRWSQVQGPAVALDDPNGTKPTFAPPASGEYVFQLVVGDDRYNSEPDQVLVLVAGNQAPVADAGADKTWAAPGQVTLDGTGSRDPDKIDRLSYQWTQREGPAVDLQGADTATPTFSVEAEGQYAFELVVSDGFAESEPSRVRGVATHVAISAQTVNVGAGAQPTSAFQPDVSGVRVVYVVAGTTTYNWEIACKDLIAGKTETFVMGGINIQPKIDGDLVVWSGGAFFTGTLGPDCTSIFVRNLAPGDLRELRARSDTSSFGHPAVSGRKVVWVQHLDIDRNVPDKWFNTPYDICGADLSDWDKPVYFTVATGVSRRDPFPFSDPTGDVDSVVDICGNIVVWEGGGNIYAADISDLNHIKVVTVCDHPARQYDPAVSGRLVVWTDERNDQGDIYGADLSDWENIREFAVVRASRMQQQPALDDGLVVYAEGVVGSQLRLACITRSHGILNADLPDLRIGMVPALDGRTLVWLASPYGPAQGLSLGFGYSDPEGRVQNSRTGRRYNYIQHAVSDADNGDEIIVPEGISEEKINFSGKALTVRSTDPNDSAVVAATILCGHGNIATFAEREGAGSVLAGFTITGGNEGILCYSTSPAITRCTITGNLNAGLRLLGASNPTITFCGITANNGAGIEMTIPATTGRVTKQVEATIRNCLIAANREQGIHGGRPTVVNCTVVENLREGINAFAPTVANSIVYFNGLSADIPQIDSTRATVSYSDVQGGWSGDGNIDADPQFVASGHWANPADSMGGLGSVSGAWVPGDYHLQSQGRRWNAAQSAWVSDEVTSPCIDAGDPASELFAEPLTIPGGATDEVVNRRIDMGMYGGTAEASLAPLSQ